MEVVFSSGCGYGLPSLPGSGQRISPEAGKALFGKQIKLNCIPDSLVGWSQWLGSVDEQSHWPGSQLECCWAKQLLSQSGPGAIFRNRWSYKLASLPEQSDKTHSRASKAHCLQFQIRQTCILPVLLSESAAVLGSAMSRATG